VGVSPLQAKDLRVWPHKMGRDVSTMGFGIPCSPIETEIHLPVAVSNPVVSEAVRHFCGLADDLLYLRSRAPMIELRNIEKIVRSPLDEDFRLRRIA
jgi:hypothetical protein